MALTKVSFAPGSRLPDNQAPIIEDELDRIADARGTLTPSAVVEAAKSPASPLHPYFEWNDAAAANEHRLSQARHLIRSVQVRVLDHQLIERQLPKYHSVVVERPNDPSRVDRVYAPIGLVKRQPALLDQVTKKIEEDLTAARRRWEVYRHIPEFHQRFAAIFEEVDALAAD